MKTYQPKASDIDRKWHLLDAQKEVLGRLSTKAASLLMGKGKVGFSSHMDMGDFVVIVNAEKITVTGKKAEQKLYRSHSGYPGGLRTVSYEKMHTEYPTRVLEKAISGMLPDNRLKKGRMARLKVVVGDKNPYEKKFKEN